MVGQRLVPDFWIGAGIDRLSPSSLRSDWLSEATNEPDSTSSIGTGWKALLSH